MSKSIPARPNLEFDRKQARALMKALQSSDATERSAARERFEQHHPRRVFEPAKLADAQLVVAREYGFASWPQWKAFVETRSLARRKQAEIALRAVCSNDLARARVLLRADPELEKEDFHLAVACGQVEVVRSEIRRDPEIARRKGGVNDWQPLEYACYSRWLRVEPERAARIVEVAALLLEYGADPNAAHMATWMGESTPQTVLFGAAGIANNADLTRLLLAAGADVNEGHPDPDPADPKASPWGTEALYHACEFRDVACLALLLEAKPHPVRVSYCLGRALDFENPEAVQLFLAHGANPNTRIPWFENRTHLQRAIAAHRSLEIIEALVEGGGDPRLPDGIGLTAYRHAVRMGREDVVAYLVKRELRSRAALPFLPVRADVSAFTGMRGLFTSTPEDQHFRRIMQGGKAPPVFKVHPDLLCDAARRNDLRVMEALLTSGAKIDAANVGDYGTSPLHWAVWRGRFGATKFLVERGADIHIVNCYGSAALGTAIHGSENCFDPEGGPAMRLPEEAFAGDYPQIVDYLISRGAKLPEFIWGGSEAVREVLRSYGVPDEKESAADDEPKK